MFRGFDPEGAFDGSGQPLVAYDAAGNRTWMLSDERGSVIALADDSAAMTAIDTYDEYGIPAAANQGPFQYTGQFLLSELGSAACPRGLYYYKARLYSPCLGRFLQTDPVGYEGGINLYGYVGGDPVNGADPSGEQQEALLFVDFDVFRSATYDSNDPNAGAKAVAYVNVATVATAVAVAGVPGSVATSGLASAARTAAVSGAAGAVVSGAIAAANGQAVAPAATRGALSSALTAMAPGGIKGRFAMSAAVANAAAVSTRASGGSNAEAVTSGVAAGVVEFASGNRETAGAAGQGAASLVRSFTTSTIKESISTYVTSKLNKLESLFKW